MSLKVGIIHTYYQNKGGEDAVFEMESALIAESCLVKSLVFKNAQGAIGMLQFIISIWNPVTIWKTKKFIRVFKPDVIHIHNLHFAAGPTVIRVAKKKGIPLVYTLHNYRLLCPSGTLLVNKELFTNSVHSVFPWLAIRNKVFRNSAILTFWLAVINWYHKAIGTWQMVDQYLVHTNFAKETYVDSSFGIPSSKFSIKPNFVKPINLGIAEKRADSFLFIGRLAEEKGLSFLLDTFRSVDFVLRIAGDGPMKNDVLEACKLAPNIKYLGSLKKDAVEKEMRECTALIFPSIWYECMPMTLLEALSFGTPIIASKLGVMTSIVSDGYNGLLFEPQNQSDFLAKIDGWRQRTEAEKKLFYENARLTYTKNYTPQKNKDLLLNIYKSTVMGTISLES